MSRNEILWRSLLGLTIGQGWVEVGQVVKVRLIQLVILNGFATDSNFRALLCGIAILVTQCVAEVVFVLLKQKDR